MLKKIKSVRTKQLIVLIPAIIIGLVAVTIIAGMSSYNSISELTQKYMSEMNESSSTKITYDMESIETVCLNLEDLVNNTWENQTPSQMINTLIEHVEDNSMINGGGIWFNPYAYSEEEEYTCPFAYRDNGQLVVDYNYVEESGVYTDEEWFTSAINGEFGKSYMTSPYFDASANIVMVTYSCPITDGRNNVGVLTLDISLDSVAELVGSLEVGQTGYALLTDKDGLYMAGVEEEKLTNPTYATDDANASYAAAMSTMLSTESGNTTFKESGRDFTVYFDTLETLGWKLALVMPNTELYANVNSLVRGLMIVCAILVVVLICIVLFSLSGMSKGLKKDQVFADTLAGADFTVANLEVTTEDEIGQLGISLNTMYDSTKGIVEGIAQRASGMAQAGENLGQAAQELASEFTNIKDNMTAINEAMMSASAATEEVNASSEEVSSSVTMLSKESEDSKQQAEEIQVRANEIKEKTIAASDSASELADKFSVKLEDSIQQAEGVSKIGEMATVISEIADQINLLSLNASIEAARAGETGRGFAVVAMEIGKLANDTAGTVQQIQEIINEVQASVKTLSKDAGDILSFINDTVKPQYMEFIEVAENYGSDAVKFHDSSSLISEMSERVNETMAQVTLAIQQIAESTQDTADLSTRVMESVATVSETVNDVSAMSQEQAATANELNESVSRFKL